MALTRISKESQKFRQIIEVFIMKSKNLTLSVRPIFGTKKSRKVGPFLQLREHKKSRS